MVIKHVTISHIGNMDKNECILEGIKTYYLMVVFILLGICLKPILSLLMFCMMNCTGEHTFLLLML